MRNSDNTEGGSRGYTGEWDAVERCSGGGEKGADEEKQKDKIRELAFREKEEVEEAGEAQEK